LVLTKNIENMLYQKTRGIPNAAVIELAAPFSAAKQYYINFLYCKS
jgi:hypothetical protein